MGMQVTVIAGQPSYRRQDKESAKLARQQTHRGVEIVRVWAYAPTKRTIVRRLWHYASFFAASLMVALRCRRPDVMLIMSTPPLLLGLSGTLVKWIRGVPFVYSVQDIYPDIARELNVLRSGVLYRALDRIASFLYRQAAVVVTLSAAMGETLLKKRVRKERCRIIPNWADTEALIPLPKDRSLAAEFGLDDTFVVLYSGNVGLSQALDVVVAAAGLLTHLPITFAIVGEGNALQGLNTAVQSMALRNVQFYPSQPRHRLAELLACADVGLVTMKRGVGATLVPSKLYGLMAAGRAVVASVDADTEVARVLGAHDCGFVCAPEDAQALATTIKNAYEAREQLSAMGRRGRAAAQAHYSRQACTRLYVNVIQEAVSDTIL